MVTLPYSLPSQIDLICHACGNDTTLVLCTFRSGLRVGMVWLGVRGEHTTPRPSPSLFPPLEAINVDFTVLNDHGRRGCRGQRLPRHPTSHISGSMRLSCTYETSEIYKSVVGIRNGHGHGAVKLLTLDGQGYEPADAGLGWGGAWIY